MNNCAIVGINWGDEGKGRMVGLLTEDYDMWASSPAFWWSSWWKCST